MSKIIATIPVQIPYNKSSLKVTFPFFLIFVTRYHFHYPHFTYTADSIRIKTSTAASALCPFLSSHSWGCNPFSYKPLHPHLSPYPPITTEKFRNAIWSFSAGEFPSSFYQLDWLGDLIFRDI